MKTNKWIVWNGGECPVKKGVLVDVIHADGDEYTNVSAGDLDSYAYNWGHEYGDGGKLYCGCITHYRLSHVKCHGEIIKKCKATLEANLVKFAQEELNRFKKATGLSVSGVEFEFVESSSSSPDDRDYYLGNVSIKVNI